MSRVDPGHFRPPRPRSPIQRDRGSTADAHQVHGHHTDGARHGSKQKERRGARDSSGHRDHDHSPSEAVEVPPKRIKSTASARQDGCGSKSGAQGMHDALCGLWTQQTTPNDDKKREIDTAGDTTTTTTTTICPGKLWKYRRSASSPLRQQDRTEAEAGEKVMHDALCGLRTHQTAPNDNDKRENKSPIRTNEQRQPRRRQNEQMAARTSRLMKVFWSWEIQKRYQHLVAR